MSDELRTTPLSTDLELLDVHDREVQARAVAIATVSAGTKNAQGTPQVSRDGTIYVDEPEQAPGLAAALADNDHKALQIAWPYDEPAANFDQRFVRYSRTKLEVYGDADKLVDMTGKEPRTVTREQDEEAYLALRGTCAVNYSFFFVLAEWSDDGPRLVFPDGFAVYRLRTTSRNSALSLISSMETIRGLTDGQLAGVPFMLSLQNYNTTDAHGMQRTVPRWIARMKPPGTLTLTGADFRHALAAGVKRGKELRLPPAFDSVDDLMTVTVHDDAAGELQAIEGTSPARMRQEFFGAAQGTKLVDAEARAAWLRERTGYDSLAELVESVTHEQWAELLAEVQAYSHEQGLRDKVAEQIADGEQPPEPSLPDGVPPKPEPKAGKPRRWHQTVKPKTARAVAAWAMDAEYPPDVLHLLSFLCGRQIDSRADVTEFEWYAVMRAFGEAETGSGEFELDEEQQARTLERYSAWANSDDGALAVLG